MQTTRLLLSATLLSSFLIADLAWKPANASARRLRDIADENPVDGDWEGGHQAVPVDGEYYETARYVNWYIDDGDYGAGDVVFDSEAPNYEMVALMGRCSDGSDIFMDGAYGLRGTEVRGAEVECPANSSVLMLYGTFDYNCRDLSASFEPNCAE